MQTLKNIPEGQRTKIIYNLIKDQKFNDVRNFLFYLIKRVPRQFLIDGYKKY